MSDVHEDDPLPALVARLELPEQGTGARAARRSAHQANPGSGPVEPTDGPSQRRPSRGWMAAFAACMVVALAASLVLTYVGLKTVRNSKAGRIVSTVTDPAAPGFEAFVEPTPTLVVLHVVDGQLRSIAVLSLNNGSAGGAVMLVPPYAIAGTGKEAVRLSVTYAFAADKANATRASVQNVLGIGIAEAVVVDDARWAELVAPVAPLTLTNPDALPGFPAGPLSLTAAQVGPWLTAQRVGESDLGRLYRQQLFWDAWSTAVAAKADDPGVVPGEVDVGIGRFVRGLGKGPVRVATIPVAESVGVDAAPEFHVQRDAMDALISDLVPFPTGDVEGARARVRLLDGTGDQQHVMRAAPLVVPAGTEIVVAGNADRFTYTTTEIRYHDPTQKAAAERIRAALGAGRIVADPRPIEAFDVTIVLGTDI